EGLLCSPAELFAIVTDEPFEADLPQFPLDDVSEIANLIEERLIAKSGEEAVLFVDGSYVPLNPFTKQFISNTLMGMVSTLKGVEKIRSLEISVRRSRKLGSTCRPKSNP
ncbi:MAG: hypothetical protein IBX36_05780, partial [Dehalococcoidia bacterium]|nr:hypothetical protein [Dehalococcoidia bacterium]